MKHILLTALTVFSIGGLTAQNATDALRYSNETIQGSARYRSLSGAMGALGGDLSAVSSNPASSAVFTESFGSATLGIDTRYNTTSFFNGTNKANDSNLNLSQLGGVLVFTNNYSDWNKVALSIAYDKVNNFNSDWNANGTNTNNSIGSYFLNNAQGLELKNISALPGENTNQAYTGIGSTYGYQNQQAYLGYDGFILQPATNADTNTAYTSNIGNGVYNQNYNYTTTGYNGKVAFNIATRYKDRLYLGLSLNNHFLDYQNKTVLVEKNDNTGIVKKVAFENTLTTSGSGFSFQLGGIARVTKAFRVGLTYKSPTWLTISEEGSQYLETVRENGGNNTLQIVDPNNINVYPEYKVKTPGEVTTSFAYVFGQRGLLSADIGFKDYSAMKLKPKNNSAFAAENDYINNTFTTSTTVRLGGEYKHKQWSFRGGYRFEGSPYKNKTTLGNLTGYSVGLGYDFNGTRLDFAYDRSSRNFQQQLYTTGLTDAASITQRNSNFTVTLGIPIF